MIPLEPTLSKIRNGETSAYKEGEGENFWVYNHGTRKK